MENSDLLEKAKKTAQETSGMVLAIPEYDNEVKQGHGMAGDLRDIGIDTDQAGMVLLMLGVSFGSLYSDYLKDEDPYHVDTVVRANASYANQIGATFVIASADLLGVLD